MPEASEKGGDMFKGYNIVITGANSGIGLESARIFLNQGARVFGLDLRFRDVEELGERFVPLICDVTDIIQIREAAAIIAEQTDCIDVLITNAGKTFLDTIERLNYKKVDSCYNLHLKHHLMLIKEILPLLKKSKYANIVCIGSIAGSLATPEEISYGMMKEATVHLVRSCAASFDSIRCNAVCPGVIRTHLMSSYMFDILEESERIKNLPMRRLGKPEEVAKLIAFLASEKAKGISGAVVTIDGGYSLDQPQINIL